jgi:DNA adenine methylase
VQAHYQNLELPPRSLIYCDPPYAGATNYEINFNHIEFWQWCREKSKEGHTIFISEYSAPGDFICVWKKDIVSSLTKNTGSKTGTEKLFRIKSE